MVLGHYCTNVATRMVEAQVCPGSVAKAAAEVARGGGAKPLQQQSRGPRPVEPTIVEKGVGGEAPGVS